MRRISFPIHHSDICNRTILTTRRRIITINTPTSSLTTKPRPLRARTKLLAKMSRDSHAQSHAAILRSLLTQYSELNYPATTVEILPCPPTPLEFMRIVSRNRPVIIRGAMDDWPAMTDGDRKWSVEYLTRMMGDEEVMVAETPLGNADSIVEHEGVEYFVKPHTSTLPFSSFITPLTTSTTLPPTSPPRKILYAQSQDSNLTGEYSTISNDVPETIPWASIALDQPLPDAKNLWIGNQWSVSSLHKDPYQNLYGVVLGSKTFTLINPLGVVAAAERRVRSATYTKSTTTTTGRDGVEEEEEEFIITPDPISSSDNSAEGDGDDGYIHWPSVNLTSYFSLPETQRTYQDLSEISDSDPQKWIRLAQPLRVTINPGEMLYLPAMWYHQVEQTACEVEKVCVAVNYWYDVDFSGPFMAMLSYVKDMTALLQHSEAEEEEFEEEG